MVNFELKICNLKEAPGLAFGWADHVISLIDSDCVTKPDFSSKTNHHLEVFDDAISEVEKENGNVLPELKHIDRILQFTKNIQENDKLLIHCHGGISRSTAVALLVLVQHGMSFGKAMLKILDQRPTAWPNELIVHHGDRILKKNGNLEKSLKVWMDSNLTNF